MALGLKTFLSGQSILQHWRSVGLAFCLSVALLLTGCQIPQVSAESRLFLNLSASLVTDYTLPPTDSNGKRVGGFSALTYSAQTNRIYALVDDAVSPKVYTFNLQTAESSSPTALIIEAVTELQDPLKTDSSDPISTLDQLCTDKPEITDESKFEHFALPHPSPPLAKGREQDSPVSPLSKGGLRGVMQGFQGNSDLCVRRSTLDGEGMVLTRRGTWFVASEGNPKLEIPPRLSEFKAADGTWQQDLTLPKQYWTVLPDGTLDLGVSQNQGFESLAINAEGDRLFAATENPLKQDKTLPYSRFLHYWIGEPEPILVSEHLYPLEAVDVGSPDDSYQGLKDLTAIDNAGHFIALEQIHDSATGNHSMLYQLATGVATDISGMRTLPPNLKGIVPIRKKLLLDLADLNLSAQNLQGLTLGPRLADGNRSLLLISDNGMNPEVPTQVVMLRLGSGRSPL